MIRHIDNEDDIVLAEAEVNGIQFSTKLLYGLRNRCLTARRLILRKRFVPLGRIGGFTSVRL